MEDTKTVFVFGSNMAGRHGKGAAAIARMQYGAIYGVGEGIQGSSYAIPTKDEWMRVLLLSRVKGNVDRFINYAAKNPKVVFKVTAIGTGLAGYSHDDIGPLFYFAPLNCILPARWKPYLPTNPDRLYWNS